MQPVRYMTALEVAYSAFWGLALLFVAAFAAACVGGDVPIPRYATFGLAYTPPLYVINPQGCDSSLYANLSAPGTPLSGNKLGPWNLWLRFGACPTVNIANSCPPGTTDPNSYCGNFYTGCLSMYFEQQDHSSTTLAGSPTWADAYDNTPYTWDTIDGNNRKAGYQSNFVSGSKVFDSIGNLVIAACVFIYVGYFLFVQSIIFKIWQVRSRAFAVLLFLLAFIFWCIALGVPSTTSQLDPKAWSTTFFQSCNVKIVKGPQYFYGVFVLATTGAFVVSEILFYILVNYADTSQITFRGLEMTSTPQTV
jgi:hypothetical protein